MLNNFLFYSKSLNAVRQNKWCCFDLLLPGKSYWQAEYLQHLPALSWRWWYQIWSGVLPQNSDILQSPIMRRWFNHAGYILSQCLWSQNVAVFHSDNWMMSVRKWGSSFETKTWDGNKLKNIRIFRHFNYHICSSLPNLFVLVWPNLNLVQQCDYNLVHSPSRLSTVYNYANTSPWSLKRVPWFWHW